LELVVLYERVGDLKGMEPYFNLGDTAGGLASMQKALALLEKLYVARSDDEDVVDQFANVLTHASMLSCSAGDVAGGLAFAQRGVALIEKLAAATPNNQSHEISLLAARHWLRFALEDNGQLPEAVEHSRQIIRDLQRLLQGDPKNMQLRRNLGVSYNVLGRDLLLLGDVAGALENHRNALALAEPLSVESPSEEMKADLAVTQWRLGRAQFAARDFESALANYRKALTLREPATANILNARAQDEVASMHADVGNVLAARNDFAGAAEALEKALAKAEEVSKRAPTNARFQARVALRYSELGRLHRSIAEAGSANAKAEWQRARDFFARSVAAWQELQHRNILMPADAAKPDEVVRELAACEAASNGRG
jgi:tetratricopeptide (TPR) repeat protein